MAAPLKFARFLTQFRAVNRSWWNNTSKGKVALRDVPSRWHGVGGTGDFDGKTTISILNKDSTYLMLDTFSEVGFRLNNKLMVLGPIAIFPKSVLCWNVKCAEELTEESMSLFHVLEPKLDILIIGVGDRGRKVPNSVIQFMQSKKIHLEILPTEQACATFNFLNSEGRYVAGAMIPPATVRVTDEDIVDTKGTKLFEAQFEEKGLF